MNFFLFLLGIAPAALFLTALILFDSFKLVRLTLILALFSCGAVLTFFGYLFNTLMFDTFLPSIETYTRYGAPWVEEFLKALLIVFLLHRNRIGLLIDAAVYGFAIGAGFGIAENLYHLVSGSIAHPTVWAIRGFGTAIMHGGATAIFALLTQMILDRFLRLNLLFVIPGFLTAVMLHSLYNQFLLPPIYSTIITLLALPVMLYVIFERNHANLRQWLELDFNQDVALVQQLSDGQFHNTKVGLYVQKLSARFSQWVIADMLHYLQLYTELSLRAKGMMLAREHDLTLPRDDSLEDKFHTLRRLRRSIGPTGLLALDPLIHADRRDLWHLGLLENQDTFTVKSKKK